MVLMRTSSVTHTNDMDQRYVGLKIETREEELIRVQGPADATVAPPGIYMLFIVRGSTLSERIPSLARFVRVGNCLAACE